MAEVDTTRHKLSRRLNAAALIVLVALFLGVIFSLLLDVQHRLSALRSATSDNVQWALSQLEIEALNLRDSTARPDADLAEVRKRFDIFYSRMNIFNTAPLYSRLLNQEDFGAHFDRVQAFTNEALPLIDGPDPMLRAALPALHAQTEMVSESARNMSLIGLDYFSEESDLQREEVALTLRRAAVMTAVLIVALSVLSVILLRLYQRSRVQERVNRETSTRLETVVNSSIDAIAVTSVKGEVLEFNPAAEAIFGYTRAEALRHEITELVLPPETAAEIEKMVEAGLTNPDGHLSGRMRLEIEVRRKDGSRFPAELSVAAASQPDGAVYVSFLRDISERKTIERALTEARDSALEGERAKAKFLAVMSHEMRTPLNGLLGSVDLLGATPLTPVQRQILDVVESSGKVLLHHVNSVLDISSADVGAMRPGTTPFILDDLVQEVVANQIGLAAAAGNRIKTVAVSGPVGRVVGDPARLRQILLNLVGNAVKFTRNGSITVEIELLGADQDARLVELRVIDTGIGIAEADQGRVFDDFVTIDTSYGRETGGTGLGLGITRRLAVALGGSIGMESEPGQGSVFWVRLPFGAPSDASSAGLDGPETVGAAAYGPALGVLVIEDNAINRFVLRSLLVQFGHRVTEATDGHDGVRRAEAEAFDLILMDISMPGLDGIGAAGRIRAGSGLSRSARIVAVTAHALPDDLSRFRAAGMDDCLVKPVTRGALTRILSGRAEPARTPAGDPSKLPLLDAAQIGDLAQRLGDTRFQHLLGRFLNEADDGISRLVGCPPDPDANRLCHHLARSAATFGAVRLAAILRTLSEALHAGSEAIRAQADLVTVWDETRECLPLKPSLPMAQDTGGSALSA